jgi:hypothetical protein
MPQLLMQPGVHSVCASRQGAFRIARSGAAESAAEDGGALLGLSLFVTVTCQQVAQKFLCAQLTLLFGLVRAVVPPPGSIEVIGQAQVREVLFKIGTWLSG